MDILTLHRKILTECMYCFADQLMGNSSACLPTKPWREKSDALMLTTRCSHRMEYWSFWNCCGDNCWIKV